MSSVTNLFVAEAIIRPVLVEGPDDSSRGQNLDALVENNNAVTACFYGDFCLSNMYRMAVSDCDLSWISVVKVALFRALDVTGYDGGSAGCYAISMSYLSYL